MMIFHFLSICLLFIGRMEVLEMNKSLDARADLGLMSGLIVVFSLIDEY